MNKLLISLILLIVVMAACSSPGTPSDPPEEDTPSATPTEEVEPVETTVPPAETIPPPTATITKTVPTVTKTTPTAPIVRPTNTPIRPAATATSTPPSIPTDTPKPAATITATATIAPMPDSFSLTLFASSETTCGYPDFDFVYDVTLAGETMTLVQVVNGLTLTGPYDPATGEFTVSISGLPGTEIYAGVIAFDGTTITLAGTYTYIDDPNQACEGLWSIFGETTP